MADDDSPYRMRPAVSVPPPPPVPAPRRRPKQPADPWGRVPDLGLVDAIPLTYEAQVNIGVGIAVLICAGAFAAAKLAPPPFGLLALLAFPVASLFWAWGCAAYAKNKGYPELVGLAGFTGYLWLMPDRSRGG